MRTFLLKITSHNGEVFSGQVVSFSARGTEGDLAILAGHTPFITYLQPGECKIVFEDGTEKNAYAKDGALVVSPEKAIVLTGEFNWM